MLSVKPSAWSVKKYGRPRRPAQASWLAPQAIRLCVNTESGWRQTRSGWAGSKDDANENPDRWLVACCWPSNITRAPPRAGYTASRTAYKRALFASIGGRWQPVLYGLQQKIREAREGVMLQPQSPVGREMMLVSIKSLASVAQRAHISIAKV